MSNNQSSLFVYYIGIVAGVLLGIFLMYVSLVKPNLLFPEDKYICVDAEPTGTDPSIVACTIVLRKDSTAHKKYLEMSHDESV